MQRYAYAQFCFFLKRASGGGVSKRRRLVRKRLMLKKPWVKILQISGDLLSLPWWCRKKTVFWGGGVRSGE